MVSNWINVYDMKRYKVDVFCGGSIWQTITDALNNVEAEKLTRRAYIEEYGTNKVVILKIEQL
mgnify:CR=1 FL=1